TQNYYDWRDRQVVTKVGVQATEDGAVNRPIVYDTLDNLGEVVAVGRYDGDGVSIGDANGDGVPDAPAASLLRAYTTANFGEQGRAYRTQAYSVDPSTGAVSSSSLNTDRWFDHRGDQIKAAQPGGLVTKQSFDGAGRVTVIYTTDGGGDAGWSDAGNVTG